MKVLVSGANGFIGRALCSHLSSLGHSVVPAVRHSYGMKGEHIVGDRASWMHALAGCSGVVHLAGRAHVMQDHETDPIQAFRATNVGTTIELANRAVEAGVRRFVFMSTIKVNGEETAPGCRFKPDDLTAPQDPYAISKWEAENGLLEIARKSGLEVVIVRPPLVYGPGVKGNFASLVCWVNSGVPLPLGAVRNCRSMIALENLVSFAALCADADASPNAKDQIFLVSDGEDVSTSGLLRKVAKAYGCNCRLLPLPAGLIRFVARLMSKASLADRLLGSLVIDGSKAREMLGWHPPLTMDEQLQRMVLHDSHI
jgi:nucleoside-diphosphate-sugar epimerase